MEGQSQSGQKSYSLSFLGLENSCFDDNLIVYLHLDNLGDGQFITSDLDENNWRVQLIGDGAPSREVSVLPTQTGGTEPGQSGYWIAFVGTYENSMSDLSVIEFTKSARAFWSTKIEQGPLACIWTL